MKEFSSQKEYITFCEHMSSLPEGFLAGSVPLSFWPEELGRKKEYPMNLSAVLLKEATPSFHALFTKNLFCGAPVSIGKKHLKEKLCKGIIINNKISNVAVRTGEQDTAALLQTVARELGCPAEQLFPSSTGIIGWRLPVKEMKQAIPSLISSVSPESLLPVSKGIMTTDSYPKVFREKCGDGSIIGTAKGAGMIEPNMGTMLCFILTDICIDRTQIADSLNWAVGNSLNRISIDGDQSTSDMVIILSSNKKPLTNINEFNQALLNVCTNLSEAIVRNGEGTEHVIRVTVKKAPSLEIAENAGKAIVNSPLVKTAIFGNDPNVGRIIGALGDYFGNNRIQVREEKIIISMGNIEIFSKNGFTLNAENEKQLTAYLKGAAYSLKENYPPHHRTVDIDVDLISGNHTATIIGADLSYDYVKENAAYRS